MELLEFFTSMPHSQDVIGLNFVIDDELSQKKMID